MVRGEKPVLSAPCTTGVVIGMHHCGAKSDPDASAWCAARRVAVRSRLSGGRPSPSPSGRRRRPLATDVRPRIPAHPSVAHREHDRAERPHREGDEGGERRERHARRRRPGRPRADVDREHRDVARRGFRRLHGESQRDRRERHHEVERRLDRRRRHGQEGERRARARCPAPTARSRGASRPRPVLPKAGSGPRWRAGEGRRPVPRPPPTDPRRRG